MKVGEISSVISGKLGIPISIFRLSFCADFDNSAANSANITSRSGARPRSARNRKEMFNNNTLDYYGIEIGSRITLDLWDGWNELVLSAIAGKKQKQTSVNEMQVVARPKI